MGGGGDEVGFVEVVEADGDVVAEGVGDGVAGFDGGGEDDAWAGNPSGEGLA